MSSTSLTDTKNVDSNKVREINKQLYNYFQTIIQFNLESTPFMAKILNAIEVSDKETPTHVIEALERQIREENRKAQEKKTQDMLKEKELRFRNYIEQAAQVSTDIGHPQEFIEKADIFFNLYVKLMYKLGGDDEGSLVDTDDVNDTDDDLDDSKSAHGEEFSSFMKELVSEIDYDNLDKDEQQQTVGRLQSILERLKTDASIWDEIDI